MTEKNFTEMFQDFMRCIKNDQCENKINEAV